MLNPASSFEQDSGSLRYVWRFRSKGSIVGSEVGGPSHVVSFSRFVLGFIVSLKRFSTTFTRGSSSQVRLHTVPGIVVHIHTLCCSDLRATCLEHRDPTSPTPRLLSHILYSLPTSIHTIVAIWWWAEVAARVRLACLTKLYGCCAIQVSSKLILA